MSVVILGGWLLNILVDNYRIFVAIIISQVFNQIANVNKVANTRLIDLIISNSVVFLKISNSSQSISIVPESKNFLLAKST